MLASIIIPTSHHNDQLLRALVAVCLQEFPADEYEVVVADDANDQATREMVEAMAASSVCDVRYVPVLEDHGAVAACCCAMREARGEFLAFTKDDCVPDPMWLANGVRLLRCSENLGSL